MNSATGWREEMLRLLKGSPQPELGPRTLAQRLGASTRDVARILDRLESEGAIRREGDRIVVVEPAASQSDRSAP